MVRLSGLMELFLGELGLEEMEIVSTSSRYLHPIPGGTEDLTRVRAEVKVEI